MSTSSFFEQLGGEAVLRPIIDDFVERMVKDVMIGFFFIRVDRDRLKAMEYTFTARFLGADVPYAGKTIRDAHAPHPIMGGQFDRRRKILEETIRAHGVAAEIEAAWLAHVDKLRPQVTGQAGGVCVDPLATVTDEEK